MILRPGDLLLVRSRTGLAGRLIRFGACAMDRPNLDNHVAVVTHQKDDVWWAVEGKPGGVGWVDCRRYLESPWTTNNCGQPKTSGERNVVVAAVKAALGTPYDWTAIAADAAKSIGMPGLLAAPSAGGVIPGHVVCSSLAAWGYLRAGLAAPGTLAGWRTVTPADWEQLIIEHRWSTT